MDEKDVQIQELTSQVETLTAANDGLEDDKSDLRSVISEMEGRISGLNKALEDIEYMASQAKD